MPGPAIGFLQECLRWWDHWLKGRDTGIMEEPKLRVWLEDPAPPLSHHDYKAGRWVAEESWPSPRLAERRWRLERGLLAEGASGKTGEGLPIASPQTVGLTAGSWCPYGVGHDQPIDQRPEAGGSLVFDTAPLAADIEVLGAPVVELDVSADRPNALLACTLSEILPGGAVSRVTYGLLNLTHRESHEHPTPLEPGKRYRVRVQMNHCGHRFAAGTRLRLAVSTAYWPVAWPSPEAATVTVLMGSSALVLPRTPGAGRGWRAGALRPAGSLAQAAQDPDRAGLGESDGHRGPQHGRGRLGSQRQRRDESHRGYRSHFRDPARTAALDPSRRSDDGQGRALLASRLFPRGLARLLGLQDRHDLQRRSLSSDRRDGCLRGRAARLQPQLGRDDSARLDVRTGGLRASPATRHSARSSTRRHLPRPSSAH